MLTTFFALYLVICYTLELTEITGKLQELFFFEDIFASLDITKQQQDSQRGRVKRPNVRSTGKLNVSLQVVFPQGSAIGQARRQA